MIISPNTILLSKFFFLSKKLYGIFFGKFFSNFLIFQIFFEILKKNHKKQKIIIKWLDGNYSNFFYNSLLFLVEKIDFIFSAKNVKNVINFENNNDYMGHEKIVFYFSNFKKIKKSLSIQNFYFKKLNFLNKNFKFNEILASFRKPGFFLTFLAKTKNRIVNLIFLQNYKFEIGTGTEAKKNFFRKFLVKTTRLDKSFQVTILFEKTKINIKGFLKKLKSNWLNFNDFIFIFKNYNKILKFDLKKKNFQNKKIKFKEFFFFLFDDFENFVEKNHEKWKQIVDWNEKNYYNLYIQENLVDNFFMNFHQLEIISRIDLDYLFDGLFIYRILKIEEFIDFNFFSSKRSIGNCWIQKSIYLFNRFSFINLISLNSIFFPELGKKCAFFESSSGKQYFLSKKETKFSKIYDINSKNEIQKFMKFGKQNLFSSRSYGRTSGKPERYQNFL